MNPRIQLFKALEADPIEAARLLVGCELSTDEMTAKIVETEAYRTPDDPACHAHRGFTPRCRSMFGDPGQAYVYFTYGNHWMLNGVAFPAGRAGAVLIRAAKPITGLEIMRFRRPKISNDRDLLSGPGKLTQTFGIDGTFDGLRLFEPNSPLRISVRKPTQEILVGGRIGIAEGKGDDLPWRFCDALEMEFVSKPQRNLARLENRDR